MKWNTTRTPGDLPAVSANVIVITRSGDERELYFDYSSKLWFLPDRSMYVYFTPRFWRYKDEA